ADHLPVEGEYRSEASPAGLSISVPRRRTAPGAARGGGGSAPAPCGMGDRLGGPRLPGVERGRGGEHRPLSPRLLQRAGGRTAPGSPLSARLEPRLGTVVE